MQAAQFPIFEPQRIFVREDRITYVSSGAAATRRDRVIFLFSDVLIIAKELGSAPGRQVSPSAVHIGDCIATHIIPVSAINIHIIFISY